MDNYMAILQEIFPNRPIDQIEDVIQMVEENEEVEHSLETMINLLSESGDSTLEHGNEGLDEAAGFAHIPAENNVEWRKLVLFMEKIFPDICPIFLWNFCETNNFDWSEVEEIADRLVEGGYELRTGNRCDAIFAQLSDMIPDADPDYLREKAELLAKQAPDNLQQFILAATETNGYPTRKEYLIRQRNMDGIRKFTRNFSIEGFLEAIPNPVEHFMSSSYKSSLNDDDITEADENYALKCLVNLYPYLREKDIVRVFKRKKNLILVSEILARVPRHFKKPRELLDIGEECENIKLLQEIAFVENKNQIKTAIKMKTEHYRLAREEAEKFGLLETCQCCYFEGLLPEECYLCKKNCPFCKDCVAKGAELAIGEGKLKFPCLTNCNSEFDISTLRMVLDKKIFDPLFTKIQIEELKRANIDGLETCPFCDFSMILSDQEKIFKCQNVDCMEMTCRECRHKAHMPLKCNEIEYDEDVRRRTYIENKMTEALVRTCWQCRKSFLKESGCNKMTCTCGAKMCYYCGANNIGYDHFGEISANKCPLYTQDLNKFHADRVIKSAVKAKEELGLIHNPQLLKIDPAAGLVEYFQQM
ncbi:uncharacterized protein LOC123673603 isoform X2 [Harmonia axyridis]|uniref:uncharacterized protein LOC123673603 isoform X2 n=1 Tax=Harmonia axyridis TaxID=115357 RepID=UPI001E278731|nr:uncharacterized protein LOC123673603 isoform X2 [Harmonia axyridis]